MTTAQLTQRLLALEATVEQMKEQMTRQTEASHRRWWVEDAGRFASDPVFDEIVRLGQEYRASLRPRDRKGRQ